MTPTGADRHPWPKLNPSLRHYIPAALTPDLLSPRYPPHQPTRPPCLTNFYQRDEFKADKTHILIQAKVFCLWRHGSPRNYLRRKEKKWSICGISSMYQLCVPKIDDTCNHWSWPEFSLPYSTTNILSHIVRWPHIFPLYAVFVSVLLSLWLSVFKFSFVALNPSAPLYGDQTRQLDRNEVPESW